ncbi:alpha/beta fold hydrolase [Streptomyces sp. E2N166]|uniref:alpha/beta fold hydrolase n=1 Tax=Streptomyces sp. E2N166 TaxID=1851909 RepID=UPI000EF727DB|nr:alpha/beta fold hydrolase [Streptomyces sp. E2N166]
MNSENEPDTNTLRVRRRPPVTRGAVLVLHGGRAESRRAARPWHLAALRMRPFLRALDECTGREDVLLGQVRYRRRGWNDDFADPLCDTWRALDQLRVLVGDVPVVLLGHSMGGRAALRAAAAGPVRGVVALAPWCPPGEPVAHLAGKKLLILHGSRDRVTDSRASAAYVRRARAADARAGLVIVENGDHAMLRHHGFWHRAATEAVAHLIAPRTAPSALFTDALAASQSTVVRSAGRFPAQ